MRQCYGAALAVLGVLLLGWSHVRLIDTAAGVPPSVASLLLLIAFGALLMGLRLAGVRTTATIFVSALGITIVMFYLTWWQIVPERVAVFLVPVIFVLRGLGNVAFLAGSDDVGHPVAWSIALCANAVIVGLAVEFARRVFLKSSSGAA
jgi:hypothetical protein